jgi:hypothetical protein
MTGPTRACAATAGGRRSWSSHGALCVALHDRAALDVRAAHASPDSNRPSTAPSTSGWPQRLAPPARGLLGRCIVVERYQHDGASARLPTQRSNRLPVVLAVATTARKSPASCATEYGGIPPSRRRKSWRICLPQGWRMMGTKACRPVAHRFSATIPTADLDSLMLPFLEIQMLLQPILLRPQHPVVPGACPIAMGFPVVMIQEALVLKVDVHVRSILLRPGQLFRGGVAWEVVRDGMAFGSGACVWGPTISTLLVHARGLVSS